MRKRILPFIALFIMVLFVACSNEEVLQEIKSDAETEIGQKITLEAYMPVPTTRVGLEQKEDLSIELTWEVGDELQLAFVKEGVTTVNKTVVVNSISADKKNAKFDIILPTGFDTGSFDLYGVYGGGEMSGTQVALPTDPASATSLEEIKNRKDVMLNFVSKSIDVANSNVSVTFEHIGSLFSITLNNTGSTALNNLQEARLVGVGGDGDWAYNADGGGQTYDLETKAITGVPGNYMSFKAGSNDLPAGSSMTFWGWYPPLGEKNWPALKLELRDATTVLAETTVDKPARTDLTVAGMSYYFYAALDGTDLQFTGEDMSTLSRFKFNDIPTDITLTNAVFTLMDGENKIIVETDKSGDLFSAELPDGSFYLYSGEFTTADGTFTYYFPPETELLADGLNELSLTPPKLRTFWAGGIIVHINEPEPRASIAAYNITGKVSAVLQESLPMFVNGNFFPAATNETDGVANTAVWMVAMMSPWNGSNTKTGPRWTDWLSREKYNGYSGWYVPAILELEMLYLAYKENTTEMNNAMTNYGGVALEENMYWSSTDVNTPNIKAINFSFNVDYITNGDKRLNARVKPFRNF